MRDIHIDRNFGSKALIVIAILALVGGIAMYVWPKSSGILTEQEKAKQIDKVKSEIATEEGVLKSRRGQIASLTWKQKTEEIGPAALANISKLVRAHGLKLVTFRPQKIEEQKDLFRIPFLMALEGSYSDVLSFTKELEKPGSKLAVNMVQLNSSDGVTDQVNATINVIAYSTDLSLGGGKHVKGI